MSWSQKSHFGMYDERVIHSRTLNACTLEVEQRSPGVIAFNVHRYADDGTRSGTEVTIASGTCKTVSGAKQAATRAARRANV